MSDASAEQPAPRDQPPSARRARPGLIEAVTALPLVAAVVGAALPWFAPTGPAGSAGVPPAYALRAGRIGFFAPLALIVAVLVVLAPRLGLGRRTRTNFQDATLLAGAGLVAAIVLVASWFLVPAGYTFAGGQSWDELHLQRGVQAGYYVTALAAALAIAVGAALQRVHERGWQDAPT